ncbi:MAG TPA: AMIN domain-containing protein [Nitrospinaceae bacterium]|nr:AMIN domain-containing protein [Nitrospinaceae bacterium]
MRFFLQKFFSANLLLLLFLSAQLIFGGIAFAASSPASIDYEKARTSYQSFFKSKKGMDRRDRWISIIKKFESVYKNHFPSNEAYKAIFTTGDLYEQLFSISRRDKDLDAALEAYQKTVKEFKPDRLTDDALYRQGEIFFSRGKYVAALNSFEKVSTLIPKGDVAAKARSRISNVRSFVPKGDLVKQVSLKETKNTSYSKENSSLTGGKKLILKKIDYKVGSDSFRVVVYTSEAVTFSQGRLSKPERVYINFKETQLADSVAKEIKIGSRFLKGLRLSQLDKENTRLVVDLNESNNLKIGVWSEGHKLFVELSNKKTPDVKVASKSKIPFTKKIASKPKIPSTKAVNFDKKVKHNKEPRKVAVKVSKKRSFPVVNKKLPLIVIDAGHGGNDLGAKGYRGIQEKNVNLAIALRLKDILTSRYKYRVILTRGDDTFIPLPGRGKIANDNNADVFVSVHANAAPRRAAHGIETYYLGQGHSEEAKATAARENGKLVKSVKDDETQEILASMISTTKINQSSRLAGNIQNQLYQSMRKKYSGVKNLGVKEGPFFVLHDTNMASVLVEVGFVTNLREESRLKQSSYLDRLASSIAKGVSKFVQDSDPMI